MTFFNHTFNLLPNSDKNPTTFSISQISDHHNHPLCWIALNYKRKNRQKTNQPNKKTQTKKTPLQSKVEDYTYQNKSTWKLLIIPYFRMGRNSTGRARKIGNINIEMYCS